MHHTKTGTRKYIYYKAVYVHVQYTAQKNYDEILIYIKINNKKLHSWE